ncbi:Glutamate synthase domain-containing protein 1 [Eubacterium aggregans]|uniref:Glutamate synthase domain-containing protein 1 n=1 Tax=Eubacterium aggregans TaxID=81409 RepID=A0A1H4E2T8_9FIRM|nr:glutamine amidotransferase family protein [Eubacterium aggregans]SEA79364.1 Glutamate synthase domain-containing protein 1 [Eubacterium aggregans]
MLRKEGEIRIPSGCAISGIIDRKGRNCINGKTIVDSIAVMHDRSNGLGGGFAGYGIYPEYADSYAFHVFYDDFKARQQTEAYLERFFDIVNLSRIPVRKNKNITDEPLIWRYFVNPIFTKIQEEKGEIDEQKFIVDTVFYINSAIDGAYIFSSGKNMGVFKAVGFPEDVGDFYKLEEYNGYCWTAHGRYPTNTPGWWGGAHPFALLDYSVVHNGEISSYDANRRYIEMFDYKCTLLTDTEVITYIIDYLNRKEGFDYEDIAAIIAAPFWEEIDGMPREQADRMKILRNTFASLLITGPFSIICGFNKGLMALNDRLKLRSMVAGEKDDIVYIASEESAIRAVCPDIEGIWAPRGGEPIIVRVEEDGKEA